MCIYIYTHGIYALFPVNRAHRAAHCGGASAQLPRRFTFVVSSARLGPSWGRLAVVTQGTARATQHISKFVVVQVLGFVAHDPARLQVWLVMVQ